MGEQEIYIYIYIYIHTQLCRQSWNEIKREPNPQTQTAWNRVAEDRNQSLQCVCVCVCVCLCVRGLPTCILLQDPAFELDDGVSKGAAVLALAAVANLVATHVELAERVQRAHFAVAHVGRPHHVHQTPAAEQQRASVGLLKGRRTKWNDILSVFVPHYYQGSYTCWPMGVQDFKSNFHDQTFCEISGVYMKKWENVIFKLKIRIPI